MTQLGVIQVTSTVNSEERYATLKDQIIPRLVGIAEGCYTLVSPPNVELEQTLAARGAQFINYTGWELDKSRKFREGILHRQEEWVVFLDDDILPDDDWHEATIEFLQNRPPGQYGFRLTDKDGNRHQFGEDWMQFGSPKFQLNHRGLNYDIETGYVEQSPTSYVANSVVHRDVFNYVQPFGLFGKAPDVNWSFAIKQAGFPIDFNPKARAYHLGDRKDNR